MVKYRLPVWVSRPLDEIAASAQGNAHGQRPFHHCISSQGITKILQKVTEGERIGQVLLFGLHATSGFALRGHS